jgi:hypothetical protein
MKISDKLDSIDTVKAAMGNARYSGISDDMLYLTKIRPSWWAVREQWRLNEGYHEITDALVQVNNHAKVFAHVSKTDRTKVAFTPDKAFGERDAQLQMNFGKLVQRVIPFASDEYVKTLTETHVAELSNEVEWIEGEKIAEVYRTTSVGSCMSKPLSYWKNYGLPDGVEPAIAYAAPGIKMAVLRDANGEINARCMVYEDGDDKRLIRAYGDGALLKRLTRLGYKHGGWQGVKFNTVKWDARESGYFKVAIPYLDAMNRGCDTTNCTIMLLDGELIGVKSENLEGLRGAGVAMTVPGTAGYVTLKNTSAEDFLVDDFFTGEKINTLTTSTTKVAVLGGGHGVTTSLDRDTLDNYVTCHALVEGKPVQGYKAKKDHAFLWDWNWYIESDAMRNHCGFRKLSPTYYTEGLDSWMKNLVGVAEDGVCHYVKSEDVVRYYDAGSSRTTIHKSKVPKKAIRLANVDGDVWYAAPGTEVLRTPSKAKVIRGLHEIKEGWQGIDYSRNLNAATPVFGSRVYHKRTDRNKPEFENFLMQKAKTQLEFQYESSASTLQRFFSVLVPARRYVYPTDGNKFFCDHVYNANVSHLSIPEFKEFLEDYKKECTDTLSQALANFCMTKLAEMQATNGEEPVLKIEAPELIMRELEAA